MPIERDYSVWCVASSNTPARNINKMNNFMTLGRPEDTHTQQHCTNRMEQLNYSSLLWWIIFIKPHAQRMHSHYDICVGIAWPIEMANDGHEEITFQFSIFQYAHRSDARYVCDVAQIASIFHSIYWIMHNSNSQNNIWSKLLVAACINCVVTKHIFCYGQYMYLNIGQWLVVNQWLVISFQNFTIMEH